MRRSRIGLIAGAFVLGIAVMASAGTLSLDARAGLGGISRSGRWTPVRIIIDNSGADVSGTLVVVWGDAEVRRDVTIPSPSRKHIQVYLRTSNVEGSIRVRMISSGIEVIAADAPLQVLGPSASATLCVRPKGAPDVTAEACDARVAADMLPDDVRGYDAFDRVVWSGAPHALEPSERDAFRRWQALRRLEDSGSLAATSAVSRPLVPRGLPTDSRSTLALGGAIYLAAFMVFLMGSARRGSTGGAYAGVALVVCLGSTAALALGRSGPASAIVVQHSTLLQQLPGDHGSAVSMRAIAEFPAFDAFKLRVAADDVFIEPAGGSETREHAFDEHGDAVLTGTFGLGAKQAFLLEGFTAYQPVALTVDGARVRLTNRSGAALRDCRLADGFSVRAIATVEAGQSVDVLRQEDRVPGPAVTCSLSELPIVFSEAGRAVHARGTVRVAAYLETES